MNIKRKLSLAVLTIGIAVSSVGCSSATLPVDVSTPVAASASTTPEAASSASPETSATAEASAPTTENKVEKVAEVPAAEPPAPPAPAAEEPVAEIPVAPAPAPAPVAAEAPAPAKVIQAAPVQAAPAPVQVAPVQAAPAVSREVYVGLAGGQGVVDQGRGPVLFPLPAGFAPYVAEHDMAGGWARFGTLSPGMTVRMSGLVTGTYTVGQIINVPKGGSTNDLRQFRSNPRVMLQTCVPGTSRMIVVGLY